MQHVQPASRQIELPLQEAPSVEDERHSLFLRNDTIFGVCEGLGEEFGFNANYLRVTLCALLYLNPVAVIAGYFALGAAVALSRLLYPKPRAAAAPQHDALHHAEAANEEGAASDRLAA